VQIEDEVVALVSEGLFNTYAEFESGVRDGGFCDRAL
jgi:hypothetical protein